MTTARELDRAIGRCPVCKLDTVAHADWCPNRADEGPPPTVQQGYFTPIAKVLCGPCNNALVGIDHSQWAKTLPVVTVDLSVVKASGHLAVCDKCKCEVTVDREDVALCQALVVALQKEGFVTAELEQTGGLCVAAGVNRYDEEDFFFAVLSEDEESRLSIGFYKDFDTFEAGEQVEGLEHATVEEAVKFVNFYTETCTTCGDYGAEVLIDAGGEGHTLCEGCASQAQLGPFGSVEVEADHKAVEFLNEHVKVIKVTVPDAPHLCGKTVAGDAGAEARGYGYRCVLDAGHVGKCLEKEPDLADALSRLTLANRQAEWDERQRAGANPAFFGPRPTR